MPSLRALASLALLVNVSAAQPATPTCEPLPVVVQKPGMAANSTLASTDNPPKRFAHPPVGTMKVAFGEDAIANFCGQPPCGMKFYGCIRGDVVVLPDPFTVSNEQFGRIARHELAHVAGWPETHGD